MMSSPEKSLVIETAKGILDTYITDCTDITWRDFGSWDGVIKDTEVTARPEGWVPTPTSTTPEALADTLEGIMAKHKNGLKSDGTVEDALLSDIMGEMSKTLKHKQKVVCVKCQCHMEIMSDKPYTQEAISNSLLSQGWSSMLGMGWKCPPCSGNAKSWDSIWNV